MTEGTPVRVLWLTPDKPASISVGRRRIAAHLEAEGYEVTLRGTTVRTLARSLRERGTYDVIVGTTRAGAIAGMVVSRLHGVPFVVDHIDPIRQYRETANRPLATAVEWLEHRAFSAADHVLYVYEEEADRVRQYASAATKTDLGLEYDRFAEPDPAAVERAEAALADSGDRIAIYVGGLEPLYNIRPLLDAAEHLEGWSIVLLGTGSLRDEVSEAAERSDAITYLGTVPHEDVPGYLAHADVGVCLVDDPHTLKVLEYAAAGLPIVQLGGRAEDRLGDLVDYCDPNPESIASAIERAPTNGTATELRQFVREYDWASIAEAYQTAITTVKYRSAER